MLDSSEDDVVPVTRRNRNRPSKVQSSDSEEDKQSDRPAKRSTRKAGSNSNENTSDSLVSPHSYQLSTPGSSQKDVIDSGDDTKSQTLRNKTRNSISKSAKRLKIFDSDDEDISNTCIITPKKTPKTPATRSSARLRSKRCFSLPSREKELEKISLQVITSSTKKMRELKPRRLVNNYIRERNAYASEKRDIYLTDESFSDFIDDGEEDDTDETLSDDKRIKGKPKKKKRKKHYTSSSSESSKKGKKLKKRKQKRNRKSIETSSDDEKESVHQKQAENGLFKAKKRRTSVSRKILKSSEEESSHSKEEDATKESSSDESNKAESFQPVRRSTRRAKLNEKEELRNQKFELIKKGRNKAKARETNEMENPKIIQSEDSKKEVIQSLLDHYSTDESDKNFLVSDNEISEEEPESDFEYSFLKLNDSQDQINEELNEDCINSSPSKASIKMRRKHRNFAPKWKRINTKLESDDNENTDSDQHDICNNVRKLHAAIKTNNIELIKQIIQGDAHCVNELGYRKRSPVHLAALNGNAEVLQLLLENNASSKILDKYGFPPIAYAAANGQSECLKVLLKNSDIKKIHTILCNTDSKMSLLHLAIGESRTGEKYDERAQCMELIFAHNMEACADMLYHRDVRERIPIEAAVYASQHRCLKVLLENGANPLSFKTSEDGNLLHFSVESASHLRRISPEHDSSLCLKELVNAMKPCLNDKDMHDFTPLMYACESGNDQCLKVLIDAGATVMIKDKYETSPLHLAALAGSTECVQLLLTYSHPVDCVDEHGWPPLLYADFNAKEECVLALMKPKPRQIFILENLLRRQRTEQDRKKTSKVVKNVLVSLANHDAYYTVFNDFIRSNPALLDEYNHGLLQHTGRAILDFKNKHAWFKRKLAALPGIGLFSREVSLVVKRDDILGSTMQQIGHIDGRKLRSNDFYVTFENEPGICTGPKREFFICFCKDAVSSSRGLFAETVDCQYSPVPNAFFSTFPCKAAKKEVSTHKDNEKKPKKEQDNPYFLNEEISDSDLLSMVHAATADQSTADNSESNIAAATADQSTADNSESKNSTTTADQSTADDSESNNAAATADQSIADDSESNKASENGASLDVTCDSETANEIINDGDQCAITLDLPRNPVNLDSVATKNDVINDGRTDACVTGDSVTVDDVTNSTNRFACAVTVARENEVDLDTGACDITTDDVTSDCVTGDSVTGHCVTSNCVTDDANQSDMVVSMTEDNTNSDVKSSKDAVCGVTENCVTDDSLLIEYGLFDGISDNDLLALVAAETTHQALPNTNDGDSVSNVVERSDNSSIDCVTSDGVIADCVTIVENKNNANDVTRHEVAAVSGISIDGTTSNSMDCVTEDSMIADCVTNSVDSNEINNDTIAINGTEDVLSSDILIRDCVTTNAVTTADQVTSDGVTIDTVTSSSVTSDGLTIVCLNCVTSIADSVTTNSPSNRVKTDCVTSDGLTTYSVTSTSVTSYGVIADDLSLNRVTSDNRNTYDFTSHTGASDCTETDCVTSESITEDNVTTSGSSSCNSILTNQSPSSSQQSLSGLPKSASAHLQSDNTTWISCGGKKDVVIPTIMLGMKMKQHRMIGRIVGAAICQEMSVNFHLSKPFIKQILGIPLSHPDDLASFDHNLYENQVEWVLENSMDDLDLPFSIETINPWDGKLVNVNLSEDDQKLLGDTNKDEYVKLVSQFKLETFIKKEVEEFKIGMNEVIPSDLLTLFTPDEFSLLLNGVTKIDVDDWRSNTVLSGFGGQFKNIIEWFWKIVSNLKEEEKSLLLQFSTGTPCVPLGGFANLKGLGSVGFRISKHLGMNKIPEASTCFNLLKLSDYDSEKQLREKLLIAIRHGSEGFSFS